MSEGQETTSANPGNEAERLARRGENLIRQDEPAAAIPLLEQAVALVADRAPYWHHLAVACYESGAIERAEACCLRVLELDPHHAKALANLGAILDQRGDLPAAERRYRDAVVADPELATARANLAMLLHRQGSHREAVEHFQRAIALVPAVADWHACLAGSYNEIGDAASAKASLEVALRMDPDCATAHEQLGNYFIGEGDAGLALDHYRRATELDSGRQSAWSNTLFSLNYLPEQDRAAVFQAHQAWGGRQPAIAAARDFSNAPNPHRKLRIGYVSPDFRTHSVAYFVAPLLAEHDRAQFDITCYSDVRRHDAVTVALRSHADRWRDTADLGNEALADRVRADAIDILVDLAGHTAGGGRMPVFARKPAPVQVSWLGYPNTTGLTAIDYRFTDRIADPEDGESDRHHTERLVRLPHGFLCYLPPLESPPVAKRPTNQHGMVTFGCFNNLAKIHAGLVEWWSRIVCGVPGGRMIVKAPGLRSASARLRLSSLFAKCGVGPERLALLGPEASVTDHLRRYEEIDIALDTSPYCGTTTTCEALWMGVPVITLAGASHVSRVGTSILNSAGLPDFVAADSADYVRKAQRLAADRPALEALRSTLRDRLRRSALLDARGFARAVEGAYREMWTTWCRNKREA